MKTKTEVLKTECDADNLTILIKGFSSFDSLMFYYKNVIMNKYGRNIQEIKKEEEQLEI